MPTMNRPGSSTSWQPVALTAGQDHLGERAGGQRLVLAVVDAEAAAHVQIADVVPLRAERLDEPDRLLASLPVRFGLEDGRTQVHVQADHRETRVADDRLRHVHDGSMSSPNFTPLTRCRS